METYFEKYFDVLSEKINEIDKKQLIKFADLICGTNKKNKKNIIVGNGGSASIASHVSVDFVKAAKIRSINFNEANFLTCFSNDYGYENWVEEALKTYADKDDILILISSSGESLNIIKGAKQAKEMGLPIVTFSGFSKNNNLRKYGDINFWVDSNSYNIIEMTHHIWLVAVVDYITKEFTNEKK